MSCKYLSKCHDVKLMLIMEISSLWMYAVQCCHSSLLELEDPNCPFDRGMCWQFNDDLVQFWCDNVVKLAAMILCIGYLARGMDLE